MRYINPTIENILQQYMPALGKDYYKYRNHVYRVFLNCLMIDDQKINEEKYAVAAVFHDIGIWTDRTIDYLGPSIAQVHIYLNKTGQEELIGEIETMIRWHHKVTRYHGSSLLITENFRKADWIDVSFGLRNFGHSRKIIKDSRKMFSNDGFHLFLLRKIIGNFFRHPLNPLPMFKK